MTDRKPRMHMIKCSIFINICLLLCVLAALVCPEIAVANFNGVNGTFTIYLLISNVSVTNVGVGSVSVTWQTTGAATSQVFYDTHSHVMLSDYSNYTSADTTPVYLHTVHITGLSPSITYYFRVKSADQFDPRINAFSLEKTIVTLSASGASGGIPYIPGSGTTGQTTTPTGIQFPITENTATAIDTAGNQVPVTSGVITIDTSGSTTMVNLPVALSTGTTLQSFTDNAGTTFSNNTIVIPTGSLANTTGAILTITDETGDLNTNLIIQTGNAIGTGNSAVAEVKAVEGAHSTFSVRNLTPEEQQSNVPQQDRVGTVSTAISLDLNTIPENASVRITTSREPDATAASVFQMVATDIGMNSYETAYVINVTKANIENGIDIRDAHITMKVGKDWVDTHGGNNVIKIFRYDPDTGMREALDTSFMGYDAQGLAIFEAISPRGLSVFGLVGVKSVIPVIIKYELTVFTDPANSGTVALSPLQPDDKYDAGTIVSLTAVANSDYSFDYWSGDASGTISTTTVTMNSNKIIIAHLKAMPPPPVTYALTVAVDPAASGTVIIDPVQPQSGYVFGTTVTVTAMANKDYIFDHWSGDANETNSVIMVTMDSNKSLVANFTRVLIPSPVVSSVSPQNGDKNVPRNSTIVIEFSQAMDHKSVEEAFSIQPKIEGAFIWSGNSLLYTPNKNLKGKTTYSITISTTAKSAAGNNMTSAYVFTITTESAPSHWRWLWAIIVAAVLSMAALFLFALRRRRKKKTANQYIT